MADQRSVEMLALNFASRTFAYKRLAQGLSRSVSAFSSFMREYLHPVAKAHQCDQYVDDIGTAANNVMHLTRNIRAVFKCIRQAGLKLTTEKFHFGVRQVEFLGRIISSNGVSPQSHKIQIFLSKLRFPKSKKALKHYLGFKIYYRNYSPRMVEKLNPFYKLLKAEVPINITSELQEIFDSVNKALSDACQLALKQPIRGKQLVLMTNVNFRSASYALMIEDNPQQKIQSKRKTYAPVAFGSKNLSPAQLKMWIYSKEFLTIYMAFLEFADILWEATKPTIVLTDNKSVTIFSRQKPFHHLCGIHAIMCYNSTLKEHKLLDQSTQQLIFSPGWNWNSGRRSVSKSGRIYKQHPKRCQHLPQMLQMKSTSSSHKQMLKMRLKSKPFKGKSSLGKKQQNG